MIENIIILNSKIGNSNPSVKIQIPITITKFNQSTQRNWTSNLSSTIIYQKPNKGNWKYNKASGWKINNSPIWSSIAQAKSSSPRSTRDLAPHGTNHHNRVFATKRSHGWRIERLFVEDEWKEDGEYGG